MSENLIPGLPWISCEQCMPVPFNMRDSKKAADVSDLPMCLIINEANVPAIAVFTTDMYWFLIAHDRVSPACSVTHWCPIDYPKQTGSWIEEFLEELTNENTVIALNI